MQIPRRLEHRPRHYINSTFSINFIYIFLSYYYIIFIFFILSWSFLFYIFQNEKVMFYNPFKFWILIQNDIWHITHLWLFIFSYILLNKLSYFIKFINNNLKLFQNWKFLETAIIYLQYHAIFFLNVILKNHILYNKKFILYKKINFFKYMYIFNIKKNL